MLEKQLKTLGQKIRIDILKKLKNNKEPIAFSRLQKEVTDCNSKSVNFSFHLNALKECKLIDSSEDGYYITVLGKQILTNVLSIEKILVEKNRVKMIRTSKYSKEIFDLNRIKDYLIKEGEMESFLARQIAQEVEERLSKTNIEYLTAPLMREYINAILLENGFEKVRHKLTRLGTPPFEAFKLFNSEMINPYHFINKLGSDVSEQFLLLNLLPNNLADLYLSGEIALLHLNYWSLRPLSLFLNTNSLLEVLIKKNFSSSQLVKFRDIIKLILILIDFLHYFKPYFSQDLVLGGFNKDFLSHINFHKNKLYLINILKSQIIKFCGFFEDQKHKLTLEFNYNDFKNSTKEFLNQFEVDKDFLNYELESKVTDNTLILFDYSKLKLSDLDDIVPVLNNNNIYFYNNQISNFLNSTLIKIKSADKNQIILDKILINLHSISVKANGNDDLFLDLLDNKLRNVFDLFNHKQSLIEKKLNSLADWRNLVNLFFGKVKDDFYKKTVKSISFFGLNEAILNHCGIELDRLGNSEEFALRVLLFMKKVITEKNKEENNYYILSQPHKDTYLKEAWHNGKNFTAGKPNKYSPRIIRHDTNLPLIKQVRLFKKFERIISGGIIFDEYIDNNETTTKNLLSNLFKSQLETIYLQKLKD